MATGLQPKSMTPRQAPKQPPRGNGSSAAAAQSLAISHGVSVGGQRVVLYGPGGIGKSELCANLAKVGIKPLFLDIGGETKFLDVARYEPRTFDEIRQLLHDEKIWKDYDAVVSDSLTAIEEFATTWTCENIKHENGKRVTSIEGYGYGKGYTHVYEIFLTLLSDFDAIVRAGKHVICTAHDCTANVPNPSGENWIRYEPRLQSSPSGKASIRSKVKEWCDHLLYIGYDVNVDEDGKASGSGTRAIYPIEQPTHMAKSRSLSESIVYNRGDAEIWKLLFGT